MLKSFKYILFTIFSAVVCFFPSALDSSLVPGDCVNVFVIFLHLHLLLVEFINDLFVDCLHNLYFL